MKILSVVLLLAASATAQIPGFTSGGGKIKTNETTGVVSYRTDVTAVDNSQGAFVINLPVVTLADLESGACLPAGGSFSLTLTGPTMMTLKGTLVANGNCASGPYWALLPEGDGYYTYMLEFGLSDGTIQGHCVLRTQYLDSLWDGSAPVSSVQCMF